MSIRSVRARGRHRKPTNHARTIGLATAPLVALIPLVTAPAAGAATTATWDRLARCESGGNWHINTGNGYYGGLQFSYSTWLSNGGGKYASRADRASKAQQIAIAERLLHARGWAPWPACSRRLGLDHSDAVGSPTAAAGSKAKPVSTHRASGKVYTVRRGDTLSRIAASHRVSGGWQKLYRINKRTIGKNPGLIRPGQRLALR